MINSTKPIDDATPLNDVSGLKLPKNKTYTSKEIYVKEAKNTADVKRNVYFTYLIFIKFPNTIFL